MRGGREQPPFLRHLLLFWPIRQPDSPSTRGHSRTFSYLKNAKVRDGAPPRRRDPQQGPKATTRRRRAISSSLCVASISAPATTSTPWCSIVAKLGNRISDCFGGFLQACGLNALNVLDVCCFGRFFVTHSIMNLIEKLKFISLFWPNLWPIVQSVRLPVGAM